MHGTSLPDAFMKGHPDGSSRSSRDRHRCGESDPTEWNQSPEFIEGILVMPRVHEWWLARLMPSAGRSHGSPCGWMNMIRRKVQVQSYVIFE